MLNPFEDLTRVQSVAPTARECGACHVEIYEEFTSSAHSQSWLRPRFVETTSGYRFEECLACHAPTSVFDEEGLQLRESHREEGVTCLSCHFDDGVMVGPAEPTALIDPHPVARNSEFFESPELCGNCHKRTMDEWRAAPGADKASCQSCHMPPVTRTLTQGTGLMSNLLVALEDEYEGRQHLFHVGTEEMFEGGLDAELVEASRGPDGVLGELVLINRVPHFVPTGSFGARMLVISIEGLAERGVVLTRAEQQLRRALGQSLLPNERRSLPVSLDPAARALRLVVSSVPAGATPTTILTRLWQLP